MTYFQSPFGSPNPWEQQDLEDIRDVTDTVYKYVDSSTLRSAYQRIKEKRKRSGQQSLGEMELLDEAVDFIAPGSRSITTDYASGSMHRTYERYCTLSATGERIALFPTDKEPYFAGFCHRGHVVSSKDIRICDHPGCGKVLCPVDRYEYKPKKFKCKAHYRRWRWGRVVECFLSVFIEFDEEDSA